MVQNMTDKNKSSKAYDDDTIPEVDLPGRARNTVQPEGITHTRETWITEPLPESTRPRKDGPGGDGDDQ